MSHVGDLWERLVLAALRRERIGFDAYGHPVGIAGNVSSSLSNSRDIDPILCTADEIQDEDLNISRILCEHAYTLAQNLDPNTEGRGVLQLRTGLILVIQKKLAKREGADFERNNQDITRLQEFYKLYREKNNVDKLREEMKLMESHTFSGNFLELERKNVKRKRVFATLKVLGTVLEQLVNEGSPAEAQGLIHEGDKGESVMDESTNRTESGVIDWKNDDFAKVKGLEKGGGISCMGKAVMANNRPSSPSQDPQVPLLKSRVMELQEEMKDMNERQQAEMKEMKENHQAEIKKLKQYQETMVRFMAIVKQQLPLANLSSIFDGLNTEENQCPSGNATSFRASEDHTSES